METLRKLSIINALKPSALDRTNAFLNKLGNSLEVAQPLSVAAIFNFEIRNNYEPKLRNSVGFGN